MINMRDHATSYSPLLHHHHHWYFTHAQSSSSIFGIYIKILTILDETVNSRTRDEWSIDIVIALERKRSRCDEKNEESYDEFDRGRSEETMLE